MSQRVNDKDRIIEKIRSLQYAARILGYVLSGIGLWVFFVGCMCVVGRGKNVDDIFTLAGFCVVPGWLLQRFGDSLFPFSKRLFKDGTEVLS
jgi:hypothetical protein